MSRAALPAAIELTLFGPPSVLVDGRPVRLPLQRAFALLAYLALQGGAVPRAVLAALLWPDADEATGRTRLRRLVYAIEQALGAAPLVADGDRLALRVQAVAVDVLRFGQLARGAVASPGLDDETTSEAGRWIGAARRPLLQGIGFGSPAFDDWLQASTLEHERLLARLLEVLAEARARRGDVDAALSLAQALVDLDPLREPSWVLLMQLHARRGDRAGVEAAYARCAALLRAEFGIPPGPHTEQAWQRLNEDLRQPPPAPRPAVRYAPGPCGAVAYTVLGQGERTLLLAPGFVCHIEIALEHPGFRRFVEALAGRLRVILFDRSGIGLSERLQATPTPQAMAADMAAILDHAGLPSAWVFGSSEGGMGALQLAITQPARVRGLCLFGSLARGCQAPDYPWALPAAAYDVWLARLVAGWGGPVGIETFAAGEQHDPALRAWWARLVRHAASPGGLQAILRGLRDADLRAALPHIRVPTLVMHRRGDPAVRFEAGRHLAQSIPGAAWQPLEGSDHFWWCGDQAPVLQAILQFTQAG